MLVELMLTVTVAISAYLYFFAKSRYRFFKEKGLKSVPVVPLFGNILEPTLRLKHMVYVFDDIYKTFPSERIVGFFEFFSPVYMLRDPDLIKQITVKDFDHFTDHRSMFSDEMDQIFSNGLFALKGEKWRDMRSTLSPAFTGSKMRNMLPFMVECGHQVVDYLKKEVAKQSSNTGASLEIELKDLFTRFATDVIANSAFGCRTDSLLNKKNEFFVTGKKMSTFSGWQMLKSQVILAMPKIAAVLKLRVFNPEITKFFKNIYLRTVKYRQENNVVRPDMINILMEVKKGRLKYESETASDDAGFATVEESDIGKKQSKRDFHRATEYGVETCFIIAVAFVLAVDCFVEILESNYMTGLSFVAQSKELNYDWWFFPSLLAVAYRIWTDDELTSQVFLFFFAGFDGISIALSFMSMELAMNPEIQDKLREEVDANYPENGDLTYEWIQKLTYLDMVVSESLRLWTPAPFIDRQCVKAYNVLDKDGEKTDIVIEKGKICIIPSKALHYDSQYWDEPEKFDPERFSAENKHKIKPFTYLPFGSGPRNCIGSRFALMELKVMLFYLIRNFNVTSCPRTMNPMILPKDTFTMTLTEGYWIKMIPRDIK